MFIEIEKDFLFIILGGLLLWFICTIIIQKITEYLHHRKN